MTSLWEIKPSKNIHRKGKCTGNSLTSPHKVSVCGPTLTDRTWQLRECIIGEQQVLEVLTATDLLIHHLHVVLGHIQVGKLLQHTKHLDSQTKYHNLLCVYRMDVVI